MKDLSESKKTVTFQIVDDNPKLHSQPARGCLKPNVTGRPAVRRHHSQPIVPQSAFAQKSTASSRWAASSASSPIPLKCPKRTADPDRWRVGRNHSDSMLHSPPKRNHSPSPIFRLNALNTIPPLPPTIPSLPTAIPRPTSLQQRRTQKEEKAEVVDIESQDDEARVKEEKSFAPLISRIAVSAETEVLTPVFNLMQRLLPRSIQSTLRRFFKLFVFEEPDERPPSSTGRAMFPPQRNSSQRRKENDTIPAEQQHASYRQAPMSPQSSCWDSFTIL
eukprot:scaffold5074_cov99-Cylindrotheca_fusiformis.AAC.6